jgi:predicted PurR-regulated permease PerM
MRSGQDDRLVALDAQRIVLFFALGLAVTVGFGLLYYSLIQPIFIGALLSYLLFPLVRWLEAKRVRRSIAVATVVFFIIAVFIFAIVRLVPISYNKVLHLLAMAPEAAKNIELQWMPAIQESLADLGLTGIEIDRAFDRVNIIEEVRMRLQAGLSGLWATWTSLLGGVLNVFMIPIVVYFMLVKRDLIGQGLMTLVPEDLTPALSKVCVQVDGTFRNVIKGQLTVAGILTLLYIIGFGIVNLIFGFKFALSIAIIAGICRVVPYLDVIVGGLLSAIVILGNFENWGQVIGVISVFAVVQAVDGIYITPRIIGERVGIHPIVVIISVFAMADWFGFWGVLLAIPAVAVGKILIGAILPYYKESRVYRGSH